MSAKQPNRIRTIYLDDKSNAYFHARITPSGRARFGIGASGIGAEVPQASWLTFISIAKLREIHTMIGNVLEDSDNG